jgi:uncharacterized RDD family membrane protein YckC
MEHIDFRTSHNLILSYPRAELIQRIVAFGIDFFLVLMCYGFIVSFFPFKIILLIASIFIFFFYHLLSEIFFMGQSLGKRIMNIRVVCL